MLLSTLAPIPKNKRGNKTDSNNYKAIAISRLLGKLFGLIVLSEQGSSLEMFKCWIYDKYDKLFNGTKSQLLYFDKDRHNGNVQPVLSVDNGKKNSLCY